jgi:hypothetical protein
VLDKDIFISIMSLFIKEDRMAIFNSHGNCSNFDAKISVCTIKKRKIIGPENKCTCGKFKSNLGGSDDGGETAKSGGNTAAPIQAESPRIPEEKPATGIRKVSKGSGNTSGKSKAKVSKKKKRGRPRKK